MPASATGEMMTLPGRLCCSLGNSAGQLLKALSYRRWNGVRWSHPIDDQCDRYVNRLFERKHEMGVNGATDIVTNANPAPRNPDTDSSKQANEFKEAVNRSTTSNDS